MVPLDGLVLVLLADNLASVREAIGPDELVPLLGYLRRRLGDHAPEVAARLQAREFILWIDGRPVVFPGDDVLISEYSQVVLYREVGHLVEVIPTTLQAWLN